MLGMAVNVPYQAMIKKSRRSLHRATSEVNQDRIHSTCSESAFERVVNTNEFTEWVNESRAMSLRPFALSLRLTFDHVEHFPDRGFHP